MAIGISWPALNQTVYALRTSEAAELRVGDIDSRGMVIRVAQG